MQRTQASTTGSLSHAAICTVTSKEMPWFQPGLSEVGTEHLKDTDRKYSGNRKDDNKKQLNKQEKFQLWGSCCIYLGLAGCW